MAGLRMTLDMFGERQIDRTLLRWEEGVKDGRDLWEQLADRFAKLEQRQFSTEGNYGSGGWPALSPAYASWKSRHFPGAKILHRTGELEESLTQRPFGIERIEAGSMTVGSGVKHGQYHTTGGPNLPQRRPVELPEGERRTWLRLIQRFIVQGKV